MPMYRKKPVVVEARLFDATDYDKAIDIAEWCDGTLNLFNSTLKIPTLEGITVASDGDYVIKGVKGEFYACKPDIFAQTYEPVEQDLSG